MVQETDDGSIPNQIAVTAPLDFQTKNSMTEAKQRSASIADNQKPVSRTYKRMEFAKGTRFTFTPKQCETPEVQELVNLLIEIERDGFVTEQGICQLNEWLESKADPNILAMLFLLDISRDVLSCGKPTNDAAFEMQLAIERVLPKHIRKPIYEKRIKAEEFLLASEKTIAEIRRLGGNPPSGLTRRQAFQMESDLNDPATENQIAYIRRLGGNPPPMVSFQAASDLIDRLLHSVKATEKQLEYIRSMGGNPPPNFSRADADELIPELQAQQREILEKQLLLTPRQLMVLRFWNRLDLADKSKWDVEQWLDMFYHEDFRRKVAWETFKLENEDDGSQRDPSWVPIGAGESYLRK